MLEDAIGMRLGPVAFLKGLVALQGGGNELRFSGELQFLAESLPLLIFYAYISKPA